MRIVFVALVSVVGLLVALVAGHFALIEIGREVVTLRTQDPGGAFEETRLWVVDVDGAPWLHSTGPVWAGRMAGRPTVELDRGGETRRYVAVPVPGPHPRIDRALREKYGIADRWVRLIAPCNEDTLPVRLEPVAAQS